MDLSTLSGTIQLHLIDALGRTVLHTPVPVGGIHILAVGHLSAGLCVLEVRTPPASSPPSMWWLGNKRAQ